MSNNQTLKKITICHHGIIHLHYDHATLHFKPDEFLAVMSSKRRKIAGSSLATSLTLCPSGIIHLRLGSATLHLTLEDFLDLKAMADELDPAIPEAMASHQKATMH